MLNISLYFSMVEVVEQPTQAYSGPPNCPYLGNISTCVSWPVSRVLSAAGRRDDHSSGTPVTERLMQPTRTAAWKLAWTLRPVPSLFGFAPGGVYRAAFVAERAVGSYPTLSPLPRQQIQDLHPGRFAFCGTFPRVTPAGRYPAPCFRGARTFLPRGLSALAAAAVRPTGSAALGGIAIKVKQVRPMPSLQTLNYYPSSSNSLSAVAKASI